MVMTDTREYAAVVACSDMLETALKGKREVWHFLFQEGYISKHLFEECLDPKTLLSANDVAGKLVTRIIDRVELDPGYYHKLVQYFQRKGNRKLYGSIARKLNLEYSGKECGDVSDADSDDSDDSGSNDAFSELKEEINMLEEKFSKLEDRTENIIVKKEIRVISLNRYLSKLPCSNKTLHREFLKHIFPKMDKNSDFDTVWNELCRYWNFLNYTLLAYLATKFGNQELVDDFEQYKEELKEFRCKTYLRRFTRYLRERKHSLSNRKLKKLVINWQKSWKTCTLEDLETSKDNVTEKFFIPEYSFYIMDAEESSISVTWAIPDVIVAALKESFRRTEMIEFCRTKLAITSVCIDTERIDLTHCQVNFNSSISTGRIDELREEVKRLEGEFADIEDSTFDAILKKQISVDHMTRAVSTPRRDMKAFFQDLLAKNSTSQDMWQALSTYWTFYNYTLLELLVDKFGDDTSKRSLVRYTTLLSEFQQRTQLHDFSQYSIMISKYLPEDSFVNVVVELNGRSFFLKELGNLAENIICEKFALPKFLLILKSFHPHTNTITWAVPAPFLEQLRSKSETCPPNLRGKHIVKTIGGKEWTQRLSYRQLPRNMSSYSSTKTRGITMPHQPAKRRYTWPSCKTFSKKKLLVVLVYVVIGFFLFMYLNDYF